MFEEAQSVNLRQMSWNIKKNHMHEEVLEFSANRVSAESNKNYCFSFEKYSNSETCRLSSWWRNAVSSCGKILVPMKRGIIHIHTFWQFRPLTFEQTMKTENTHIDSYCTSILSTETLTGKSWQLLWREQKIIIKTNHTNIHFWKFWPTRYSLQRTKGIAKQSSNNLRVEECRLIPRWRK